MADGEVHWASIEGSRHAGQVWAVEVELTPKTAARTERIMSGLLAEPGRYALVVYLASAAARPVVARVAAGLPSVLGARVAVRDLPPLALMPGASP